MVREFDVDLPEGIHLHIVTDQKHDGTLEVLSVDEYHEKVHPMDVPAGE